ncbi:MAG: hypothetical protein ACJARG_000032 [Arcticibacterium sp.]|jgi:hypothetical protein
MMNAKVGDIQSDTRKNPEIWRELDAFFSKISDATIYYYKFRDSADKTNGEKAHKIINEISDFSEDPLFRAYFNIKSLMFQLENKRPPTKMVLNMWKLLLEDAVANGDKEKVEDLSKKLREGSASAKISLEVPEVKKRKELRAKLKSIRSKGGRH